MILKVLTPQAQLSLQETIGVRTDVKNFEQSPMSERRECKMQNFISFPIASIIFENFWARGNPNFRMIHYRKLIKLKFENHFIIYQNCPFKAQFCLAGYAQKSVPGELNYLRVFSFCECDKKKFSLRYSAFRDDENNSNFFSSRFPI